MEPVTYQPSIRAVWADALFVTVLQGSDCDHADALGPRTSR